MGYVQPDPRTLWDDEPRRVVTPPPTVRFFVNRRHVKFLRGWFAWELQIGSIVFQFVHREHLQSPLVVDGHIRRLSVWRVPF